MGQIVLASMSLIGLMSLCAWHNRKTGWVKQRGPSLGQSLEALAEWQRMDRFASASARSTTVSQQAPAPAPAPIGPQAAFDFSGQLANFAQGLGKARPVRVAEPAAAAEKVHA